MNKIKVGQGINLDIKGKGDCNIFGSQCAFNQNIGLDFVSENIVDSLVNNVINDTNIQRMINDNTQTVDLTKRGLDDTITSIGSAIGKILGILVVILGIVAYVVVSLGKNILPTQSVTEVAKNNPKLAFFMFLFAAALGIFLVYIVIALLFGYWPFTRKPKVYWVCEKINDLPTGKCVPSPKNATSAFVSEEACVKSKCDQYWGCEKKDDKPTGKCVQYTSADLGPVRSKAECEEKVQYGMMCSPMYGCALTSDQQFYEEPAKCVTYSDTTKGKWTKAQCSENIGKCANKWKCFNNKCEKAAIGSGLGMFDSELECREYCKKKN
jgi:hypothetical protein